MATPKLRLVSTSKKLSTTKYETLPIGIHLPNGRYVTPGARIITQSEADGLPSVGRKIGYKTHKRNLSFHTHLCMVTTEQKKQTIDFATA